MTASERIQPTVEPVIEHWPDQPYLALTGVVTLETISTVERRVPELFAHLAAEGIEPTGAPFTRYLVIDMFRRLEIEAGVPIGAPARPHGEFHPGLLPAGRYVTATHIGPPSEHIGVVSAIFAWAEERNLVWDVTPTDEGDQWGGRIAITLAGFPEGPDAHALTTRFAFRLAD
jgi:hypothetical protein